MITKTIKSLFVILLISQGVFAQESSNKQTLLGGKINKIGLVGSLSHQYTSINGDFKPAMGGSLSLLFNEKFAIGLAGYHFGDRPNSANALQTRGGVGGLQLEYIVKPSKLVHLSFPLLVGMGSISSDSSGNRGGQGFRPNGGKGSQGRFGVGFDDFNGRGDRTHFAVIQPGVNVEVNVLKYLTIFGGANYRIALNSNSSNFTNSKLSGVGFQLGIKAGLFGVPLKRNNH